MAQSHFNDALEARRQSSPLALYHLHMMKRIRKLAMYLQFAEMARDLHHKDKKTLQARLVNERSTFDQKLREHDEQAQTRMADERQSFDQKLRERDEQLQTMQHRYEAQLAQLREQNQVLQSSLRRLQHDYKDARRQLEAAQQTIKRTERRVRQAEECAQQTQRELHEQKECLSKQVAHLEASREETRARCQDLTRRLEHHLDERLASSAGEHFDSLQEFPHNQQIAARYRLVVTELRLDALEWIEGHGAGLAVHSNRVATWLQLAIQLCFGWVTRHKLPQHEKTLELAFVAPAPRVESKDVPIPLHGTTAAVPLETDASASVLPRPAATHSDSDTVAAESAQHALWQCKHEYPQPVETPPRAQAASHSSLRPLLLTVLRHVHKSHTHPDRLLSEAKWIWDEICHAMLSPTVVLWSQQLQDFMTGSASAPLYVLLDNCFFSL